MGPQCPFFLNPFFGASLMDRFPVSKYSSARSFERAAGQTRAINHITPLRGGWRL
jgi:hypothetical protein